jgi:methoxymalonate biosynthesis acyl carrier protein
MKIEVESEIKTKVASFLRSSVNLPDLKDDDDLFETGIVNSLFAIQLITFLEKTFDIEVGSDDLDMRNFESINATAAFVTRKNGNIIPK